MGAVAKWYVERHSNKGVDMSGNRIPVSGAILRWARRTANLDRRSAAQRAKTTVEQLTQWEEESLSPTVNQLRVLSSIYSRPLGTLLMPEPPEEDGALSLPDFRSASEQESIAPAALQRAILRARQQREDLLEISEILAEDPPNLPTSFRFSPADDPEGIGSAIRSLLTMDEIPQRKSIRPEEILRMLTRRIEEQGILVIQTQRVPIEAMRGFSLAEDRFPLIALNGADWPRGKIFTLLHELVHVGLRASGLCDLQQESSEKIERLCDAAAGAALLPREKILARSANLPRPLTSDQMSFLGVDFGASGEAVTLRLVSLGKVKWEEYLRLRPIFRAAYRTHRKEQKDSRNSDAPLYYQMKVRDLGRPFIRTILRAYGEDALSSRDLAAMLDMKYDKVPRLRPLVEAG